ncbi:MAG TPA: hypothetical protein VHZ24_09585 [Pirellulales bacterium]|jgi:hypothetical protein|nr:hypothetical protein [Pirellulales bacterium]
MRSVGRALQHLGLILAPFAILLQMSGGLPKGWQELAMLGGCVCLFAIGRLLEAHARGQ